MESLEIAKNRFASGKQKLENGLYQQAVEDLETASGLLASNTRLAGEVDIWLVTAYDANGRLPEAIALCGRLTRHPDYETRHQAQQLIYILQAPKLKRPKEWLTEIPDLGQLAENQSPVLISAKPKISTSRQKLEIPAYEDLSQVNTKDNRFIWVALIAAGLVVSYIIWLST